MRRPGTGALFPSHPVNAFIAEHTSALSYGIGLVHKRHSADSHSLKQLCQSSTVRPGLSRLRSSDELRLLDHIWNNTGNTSAVNQPSTASQCELKMDLTMAYGGRRSCRCAPSRFFQRRGRVSAYAATSEGCPDAQSAEAACGTCRYKYCRRTACAA
jgi:hypothetical protein